MTTNKAFSNNDETDCTTFNRPSYGSNKFSNLTEFQQGLSEQDCSKSPQIANSQCSTPLQNSELSKNGQKPEESKTAVAQIDENFDLKLYKKRFWMLGLFATCSMLNAMQFLQFSVISNIVQCYYNTDVFSVSWTTLVYAVVYPPLVLPVSWYIQRYGLRTSLLTGSFLTFISTVIQCLSQERNRFAILMTAQTLTGIAEMFILPVPPKLSSVWFGANEVCRATSIGTFGNQLGIGLGMFFSPMVVKNDCDDKESIKKGLGILAYTLTACNFFVFILILTTFQVKPPKPPSLSEASKMDVKSDYKKSSKLLLKNRNFVLLAMSYGLIMGVCFALSTVLNPMVLETFENAEKEIGTLGAVMILAGLFGSVVAGFILDKTHRFKATSLGIFILSLVGLIAFEACLYSEALWLLFLVGIVLGFFLSSFVSVGFEYATEVTYPLPEDITAGFMNASLMAFLLFITLIGERLLVNEGRIAANGWFCVCILVGCILVGCIKSRLLRTESNVVS